MPITIVKSEKDHASSTKSCSRRLQILRSLAVICNSFLSTFKIVPSTTLWSRVLSLAGFLTRPEMKTYCVKKLSRMKPMSNASTYISADSSGTGDPRFDHSSTKIGSPNLTSASNRCTRKLAGAFQSVQDTRFSLKTIRIFYLIAINVNTCSVKQKNIDEELKIDGTFMVLTECDIIRPSTEDLQHAKHLADLPRRRTKSVQKELFHQKNTEREDLRAQQNVGQTTANVNSSLQDEKKTENINSHLDHEKKIQFSR